MKVASGFQGTLAVRELGIAADTDEHGVPHAGQLPLLPRQPVAVAARHGQIEEHGLRWPQTDDFQRPLGGIGDLGAKAAESAVSRSSSTTRTRDRLAGPSNIDMIHPPAGRAWGRPTKDKTANTTGIRRAARGKFNKCPKTGFVARNEDLGDELRALSPFRTGSKKLSGAQ